MSDLDIREWQGDSDLVDPTYQESARAVRTLYPSAGDLHLHWVRPRPGNIHVSRSSIPHIGIDAKLLIYATMKRTHFLVIQDRRYHQRLVVRQVTTGNQHDRIFAVVAAFRAIDT